MNIDDLFIKYGTDKGGPWGWGYSPMYQAYLEPRRFAVTNVLEIGICGHRDIPGNVVGASLFAWRDFFPNAQIFGLDNDGRFIFHDQDRIRTRLTDAYSEADLEDALAEFGTLFDFVCDDAVHDPEPQVRLCAQIWPFVRPGGLYAIEDVCPYKAEGEDLSSMIRALEKHCAGIHVKEYATHKAERLLICTKDL
jgi:SAM-dependent methyltransferase